MNNAKNCIMNLFQEYKYKLMSIILTPMIMMSSFFCGHYICIYFDGEFKHQKLHNEYSFYADFVEFTIGLIITGMLIFLIVVVLMILFLALKKIINEIRNRFANECNVILKEEKKFIQMEIDDMI